MRRRRADAGQSLVEFAIILPLLLGIVIGIFEFGRAWNVYQVLTNTAREGARAAVIRSNSDQFVDNVIRERLQSAALEPDSASVTIVGRGDGAGQSSSVQVSYPYRFQFLGPIVALLDGSDSNMAGTLTLSTTAVMRNEQ